MDPILNSEFNAQITVCSSLRRPQLSLAKRLIAQKYQYVFSELYENSSSSNIFSLQFQMQIFVNTNVYFSFLYIYSLSIFQIFIDFSSYSFSKRRLLYLFHLFSLISFCVIVFILAMVLFIIFFYYSNITYQEIDHDNDRLILLYIIFFVII